MVYEQLAQKPNAKHQHNRGRTSQDIPARKLEAITIGPSPDEVDLTNLKTQGNIQNQSLDLMAYKKEKRSKYLAKQKSKKTIIEPASEGPPPTRPEMKSKYLANWSDWGLTSYDQPAQTLKANT